MHMPKMTSDKEREAVLVSIETVAAQLAAQVASLQRFVAQLRPTMTPASKNGKAPS